MNPRSSPTKNTDTVSFNNPLNYQQFVNEEGMLPVNYPAPPTPLSLKAKANGRGNAKFQHKSLNPIDRPAFFVLLTLYMLQGIPVGLAMGSVPYILKSNLSYAQIGLFSFASYPYSLKLLWLPIIDAIYSQRLGRRKLWIIPIQTISGLALLYLSAFIDTLLEDPLTHLSSITWCFFMLVMFCATQDIAVDGWALTSLLSESLSYASTAQTIGINTGYFSSFTIFLALNSPSFANKFLRSAPSDDPILTMGQYLRFWGFVFLIVSVLLFFVPEDPAHLLKRNQAKLADERAKYHTAYNTKANMRWIELKGVYVAMLKVLQLPNIQSLVVILLVAKVGFSASEAATSLRLLEKGLSKEDLSISVLLNFPFELLFGYYAGGWLSGNAPLQPWLLGFAGRLVGAALAPLLVMSFPKDKNVGAGYFSMIVLHHLLCTFMATIQVVSLNAFFTKIADPAIGGTYMTTLNTLLNYGGTWPRLIVLFSIDKLTSSVCSSVSGAAMYSIATESDKAQCKAENGLPTVTTDGYYLTNTICVTLGIFIWFYVKRKANYLQTLPPNAWRVHTS